VFHKIPLLVAILSQFNPDHTLTPYFFKPYYNIILPHGPGFPKLFLKVLHLKFSVYFSSPLCLTKHHAMKAYGGVDVYRHAFLTSALDGGEWSASRLGRFTPRERAHGTHWVGGWVGPKTVLDAMVKRKIPRPRRESNPRTPIVQPIAQRYTTELNFANSLDTVLNELAQQRLLIFHIPHLMSISVDNIVTQRMYQNPRPFPTFRNKPVFKMSC
jgi:hypothetical protein